MQFSHEILETPKTQAPQLNLSTEIHKLFLEQLKKDLDFYEVLGFTKYTFLLGVRKGEPEKEVEIDNPKHIKTPHLVMFCTKDKKEITKLKKSKKKQVPSPITKRENSLSKFFLTRDDSFSIFQKQERGYGIFIPEERGGPKVVYFGFLNFGKIPNGLKKSKIKKTKQYSTDITELITTSIKFVSK